VCIHLALIIKTSSTSVPLHVTFCLLNVQDSAKRLQVLATSETEEKLHCCHEIRSDWFLQCTSNSTTKYKLLFSSLSRDIIDWFRLVVDGLSQKFSVLQRTRTLLPSATEAQIGSVTFHLLLFILSQTLHISIPDPVATFPGGYHKPSRPKDGGLRFTKCPSLSATLTFLFTITTENALPFLVLNPPTGWSFHFYGAPQMRIFLVIKASLTSLISLVVETNGRLMTFACRSLCCSCLFPSSGLTVVIMMIYLSVYMRDVFIKKNHFLKSEINVMIWYQSMASHTW